MPRSEVDRWRCRDGLLLEDRLSALGVKHGFTTRRAGDMADPVRRRETAAGLGLPEPLMLRQVHGTTIHEAALDNAGKEGDGWLLSEPGLAVAVYVADCVPLFLWSDGGRPAGIFHAGWRGTAENMAGAAVAALGRLGVPPGRLSAALGPHVGACCYRMDLAAQTRRQLIEAGLRADRLGAPAPCTSCDPDSYYSFRRDKTDARMIALLSLDRWHS